MIKIIASDLDGTLLNEDHQLESSTRELIKEFRNEGYIFGIATGRPMSSIRSTIPDVESLFDFVVCENGGFVHDFKNPWMIEQFPLRKDQIETLINTYLPMGGNPVLSGNGYLLTEFEDNYNRNLRHRAEVRYGSVIAALSDHHAKIIFSGEPDTLAKMHDHFEKNPQEGIVAFYSQKELLEFMDPRVNKMVGLKHVLNRFGFSEENLLTFGDNGNDINMVFEAGVGIAVANATDHVKSVADVVTDDGFHIGVENYLKSIKKTW